MSGTKNNIEEIVYFLVVGRIKFFHTKMPIFWLFFVINFVCLLM